MYMKNINRILKEIKQKHEKREKYLREKRANIEIRADKILKTKFRIRIDFNEFLRELKK